MRRCASKQAAQLHIMKGTETLRMWLRLETHLSVALHDMEVVVWNGPPLLSLSANASNLLGGSGSSSKLPNLVYTSNIMCNMHIPYIMY